MRLPAHLAGQEWTPDRVQSELVREDQHWPRYELIDGELLVSPAPRVVHQAVVTELLTLLIPYVLSQRLGRVFTSPADIRLGTRTTTQPDVFVVPRDVALRPGNWDSVTRLLLVAEVLSESTAGYDRLRKREFYARRGVPEYWVVDADAELFEVSRPTDPRVELYGRELQWRPDGAAEPLAIDVPAFFARVCEGFDR